MEQDIQEEEKSKIAFDKTSTSFYAPEYSKWVCYLSGYGTTLALTYIPVKDAEPNWFNRKMQGLCFGFKWVKR